MDFSGAVTKEYEIEILLYNQGRSRFGIAYFLFRRACPFSSWLPATAIVSSILIARISFISQKKTLVDLQNAFISCI
jgi:hypothetical protein